MKALAHTCNDRCDIITHTNYAAVTESAILASCSHRCFDIQILTQQKAGPGIMSKTAANAEQTALIFYDNDAHQLIEYSHHHLCQQIYQLGLLLDHRGTQRVYNDAGIHNYYGLIMGCLVPLVHGIPQMIQCPRAMPAASLVDNWYISDSHILVTTAQTLADCVDFVESFDTQQCQKIFLAHSDLDSQLSKAWQQQAKCYLYTSSLLTDYGPIIIQQSPYYQQSRPDSLGKLLPGMTYNSEQAHYPQPQSCAIEQLHGPQIPASLNQDNPHNRSFAIPWTIKVL